METTTSSQFINDIAPERPQFLKVLCILTWVACGLMFLSSLSGLFMQPSLEEQQNQIEKMRELSPEAADKMEAALSSQSGSERTMNAVLNLVSVLLSAYGAVMMWKLKKAGFYVYILGEVLPYLGFALGGAAAMSAVAGMAGGMGSAILGGAIAFMVILDVVFIVLYALNLKYMK